MLDAVTLESSGAPVVHVHRQRHGNRAFGVRRPFAIAFIDVQVISDDAKLLASHPENFIIVNRVCRCICATLVVHGKLLFALSTRRRQLRNFGDIRRCGERTRLALANFSKCLDKLFDRGSGKDRFGEPPKPAREPRATLTADVTAQHRQGRVNLANVRK
jgi:hypothetical protein